MCQSGSTEKPLETKEAFIPLIHAEISSLERFSFLGQPQVGAVVYRFHLGAALSARVTSGWLAWEVTRPQGPCFIAFGVP